MRSDQMLVAVYYGPSDLRIEHRPIPRIEKGEALVAVLSAGICGTDLRILREGHRKLAPGTTRVLGHEVVGEIAELGDGVHGTGVGQRVFIAPNIGCGVCRQCVAGDNNLCHDYAAIGVTIDGAFADYMRVPRTAIDQGNLIAFGTDLDPAVGTLIEPLACVLRGQDAVAPFLGETVLIVGAGPIGILHMMLARAQGAGRVIVGETVAERLTRAKELGADDVIDPAAVNLSAKVFELTDGQGANVVIVAVSSAEAQEAALASASIGGRVNLFGGLPAGKTIRVEANLVHYRELVVTGTTGCSSNDCHRAAEILGSGKMDLSSLVSSRFALSRIRDAFEAADNRRSLKVVVEPGAGT